MNHRFIEKDMSIFFPRIGFCFHKSFVKKFHGKDIIYIKRAYKGWFTHREKDEIVHYLKEKNIIKTKP